MSKVFYGESLTGDLKESTWTFEVKNPELRAGKFAIVEADYFNQMRSTRGDLIEDMMSIKEILESPELIDAGDLRRIVNNALDRKYF